jgi:hypothetical protein
MITAIVLNAVTAMTVKTVSRSSILFFLQDRRNGECSWRSAGRDSPSGQQSEPNTSTKTKNPTNTKATDNRQHDATNIDIKHFVACRGDLLKSDPKAQKNSTFAQQSLGREFDTGHTFSAVFGQEIESHPYQQGHQHHRSAEMFTDQLSGQCHHHTHH